MKTWKAFAWAALACAWFAVTPLAAADIEIEKGGGTPPASGDQAKTPSSRFVAPSNGDSGTSSALNLLDAGDAPTAYLPAKYEVKSDIRFYEQGGIRGKAYVGLFNWLMIGGGLNLHGFIGNQAVTLGSNDAKAIFKLRIWPEDADIPGFAVGYDGPAYSVGRPRGLYLAASKEFKTPAGFWQLHGGVNSFANWGDFNSSTLSGWVAGTALIYNLIVFAEADDLANPAGASLNAGARYIFDPIQIGLEFRNLGGSNGAPFRLLRVGYTGLF